MDVISCCNGLDVHKIPSPCYITDLECLRRNLLLFEKVRCEAKVLLALKGYAQWSLFPLLSQGLDGTCASSIDEARLGFEEFGPEVHAYAPAYKESEIEQYQEYCTHISFNSIDQWQKYQEEFSALSCGLRINPEHSEVEAAIYDPCAPHSRLGIRSVDLRNVDLDNLAGIHFHNLCEKDSYALERTLTVVEKNFAAILAKVNWVNFGGGHHITRSDYNIEHLVRLIRDFKHRYGVEVFLEPGEAVALNAGILVAEVLDLIDNDMNMAILDTSAAAHMPDVLEMPYRPRIAGAGSQGEYQYNYRLGGLSCLAGDIIGDYSFPAPLEIGSRLIFGDMAHYSMVKNTTFNGLRLPSIATYDPDTDEFCVVRKFGYEDYKGRLS